MRAITDILEEMNIEVVGTATTPESAADLVRSYQPSLFIIEPSVMEADGSWMQHIASAVTIAPKTKIVALSDNVSDERIAAAIACGVTVYGSKTLDQDDIKAVIRQAFKCTIFHARNLNAPAASEADHESLEEDGASLTRREKEVVRLVAQGMTNAQIAGQMWITEETVKFHLSNTYRKIGVKNRTQASRWVAEHGLIPDTPSAASQGATAEDLELQETLRESVAATATNVPASAPPTTKSSRVLEETGQRRDRPS
jgi:DNA-binding NarL/FixJ family response regulator